MINNYIKQLIDRVSSSSARLILPEIGDSRIDLACKKLKEIGIDIINISDYDDSLNYISHIKKKKFTNNWTEDMLKEYVSVPINKALILLDLNYADCLIAGATIPSADVIKSSIRVIGLDRNARWVSSCFFMISPNGLNAYTYADCGVIPEPNSNQLSSIAYNAAMNHELISQEEPKVAFLSFSTNGSAQHYTVDRVKDAVKIFSNKYSHILCEGDIQFDAAINKSVSMKKNSSSLLKGDANVFIFPNLNAANIAYKITQYLAGYSAWGPLLNGFNKPVHDLSRGCSTDDIMYISMIGALQSQTN